MGNPGVTYCVMLMLISKDRLYFYNNSMGCNCHQPIKLDAAQYCCLSKLLTCPNSCCAALACSDFDLHDAYMGILAY